MKYETSFSLNEDQTRAVNKTLSESKKKYEAIKDIILESDLTVGEIFNSDLEE